MPTIRRVIVTREEYVNGIDHIQESPSVRGLWHIPRGILLFESFHPVFDRVYNTDRSVVDTARRDRNVQVQLKAAIEAERAILERLFIDKPGSFQGTQLFLPGKTAFALFMGDGQLHFPELKLYAGWEDERVLSLELRTESRRLTAELNSLISEWGNAAMTHGLLANFTLMDAEFPTLHCSFLAGVFDAVCALHRMLAESYVATRVGTIERSRAPHRFN